MLKVRKGNEAVDFIQRFPNISRYIQNNVNQDVMNSNIILAAFSRNTAGDNPDGIGNLTLEAVDYATTYGEGPIVIADPDPGGVAGGNGYYNEKTNTIELNTSNLTTVEAILASDASVEEKQKALYKISSTLLHETVHYGDYLDGIKQDTQEPGVTFEREVWGKRWDGFKEDVDNPAQRYYHHSEKFTMPELTDQLFEFFTRDEELRATLPNQ